MYFKSFLALLAFVAVSASEFEFNVTTSTQEFYLLSNRQFKAVIAASEAKINAVTTRGADHVKLFEAQHQIVLQEIARVDQSLVPLQALSLIRKHCVQKYKPLLLAVDVAKKQFSTCLSNSKSRINYLTSTPTSYLGYARTAVDTTLPKAIASCNTTYVNNQTALEDCVLNSVNANANTMAYNLNLMDKYLETNLCSLSDIIRDAIQCGFLIEKNSQQAIGAVLYLIEICVKEKESVCPCANPNVNATEIYVNGETSSARNLIN